MFIRHSYPHSSLVSQSAPDRRFAICRCAAPTAGRRRSQEQLWQQLPVGIVPPHETVGLRWGECHHTQLFNVT
jgi:hypothetical protein